MRNLRLTEKNMIVDNIATGLGTMTMPFSEFPLLVNSLKRLVAKTDIKPLGRWFSKMDLAFLIGTGPLSVSVISGKKMLHSAVSGIGPDNKGV